LYVMSCVSGVYRVCCVLCMLVEFHALLAE
jgi:hypothetical protein